MRDQFPRWPRPQPQSYDPYAALNTRT